MKRNRIWLNVGCWVVLASMTFGQEEKISQEQIQFFESKIRPVLVEHCYRCHAEESKEIGGSLRVDTRAGLLQGGDSGAAVEPGNPRDSLLLLAISYDDEDFAMPPKDEGGKLPDNVIADFEKWIRMGAPDPREGDAYVPESGADETALQWWAFQPLRQVAPGATQDSQWAKSDIDRYILAKLDQAGLKPGLDAEPQTLLRRVYFDLIGIPPSAEEAQSFVDEWNRVSADSDRERLWAGIVDQLLESPQFGERWGRYWLDVARYSESSGKDVNILFPQAWRYRDYVIDSINQDVPYNQFIREQIAGDLLPAKAAEEKSRNLVATGFLAMGPKSLNEQKPKQFYVDLADEQIDSVTQSVLGLTVACARCHDHKFDPISQKDYTALLGVFLSTDTRYGTGGGVGGRNAGTLVELPDGESTSYLKSMTKQEYEAKKKRLESLQQEARDFFEERQKARRAGKQDSGLNAVRITTQISQLQTELKNYNSDGTAKAMAMGVQDKSRSTGESQTLRDRFQRRRGSGFDGLIDSPLFIRGDVDRPSDKISRSIPEILPGVESPKVPRSASGRKQLADWMVDPENPLTSRVMVNRAWHWLFGAGIVTSVDNFGTTGSEPSHPELLDHLATQFVQEGWSLKKLVRQIVLSRTYRLSSQFNEAAFTADPTNALLWRHSPRRLDAEAIRDAMLYAGGTLDLERPDGSLIGRAGDGPLGGPRMTALTEDSVAKANSNVRSVYMSIARNVEPEILSVFDFPDGSAVQGARQVTNVPSQSLYMLNSEFAAKTAKNLAKRVLDESASSNVSTRIDRDDIPKQLDQMYWIALGRAPSANELSAARKLLSRYRKDASAGWTSVARALIASAEFRGID